MDPEVETRKVAELRAFKARRDEEALSARLDELRAVAETDENLMPATIEAVRARATGGEIVEAVRAVYGSYVETAVF